MLDFFKSESESRFVEVASFSGVGEARAHVSDLRRNVFGNVWDTYVCVNVCMSVFMYANMCPTFGVMSWGMSGIHMYV
jgi:hypothetical protein